MATHLLYPLYSKYNIIGMNRMKLSHIEYTAQVLNLGTTCGTDKELSQEVEGHQY